MDMIERQKKALEEERVKSDIKWKLVDSLERECMEQHREIMRLEHKMYICKTVAAISVGSWVVVGVHFLIIKALEAWR